MLQNKHTKALRWALARKAQGISDANIMALPDSQRDRMVQLRAKALEGDLHSASELTDFAIMFTHEGADAFVARKVFSTTPVAKRDGKILKFAIGPFSRAADVKMREPGATVQEVEDSVSTVSFRCQEWAVRKFQSAEERSAYPSEAMANQAQAALLTELLLMSQDYQFATEYMKTGAGWTDVTPGTKFDANGGDMIGYVRAAIRAFMVRCKRRPTGMLVGPAQADYMQENSALLDKIKYTQKGIVTADLIAAVFGLKEVLFFDSVYESAAEGAASSMASIAGAGLSAATDFLFLYHKSPTQGIDAPETGKIFSYSEFDPVAAQNGVPSVVQYDHWDPGMKGIFSHASAHYDIVQTSSEAGTLIYNTLT